MKYRLREIREEKGYSQSRLAQLLNMSQTGYSKYETGENDIPTKTLIALAEIYNVTIGQLLGAEDY